MGTYALGRMGFAQLPAYPHLSRRAPGTLIFRVRKIKVFCAPRTPPREAARGAGALPLPCMVICWGLAHILSQKREDKKVQLDLEERCVRIGQYMVDTGATVRETAKSFGISKSSVHKDVHQRLPQVSQTLASQVRQVLAYHKSVRHLRGGEATRRKYSRLERRI